MKIRIHSLELKLSAAQREKVEGRLAKELARFGTRIHGVALDVTKGVKSKKGFDRHCRLEVTMAARTVLVEQADPDLQVALSAAVERAARTVARMIEREHWPVP